MPVGVRQTQYARGLQKAACSKQSSADTSSSSTSSSICTLQHLITVQDISSGTVLRNNSQHARTVDAAVQLVLLLLTSKQQCTV
jgi:hypothetical protein